MAESAQHNVTQVAGLVESAFSKHKIWLVDRLIKAQVENTLDASVSLCEVWIHFDIVRCSSIFPNRRSAAKASSSDRTSFAVYGLLNLTWKGFSFDSPKVVPRPVLLKVLVAGTRLYTL